MAVLSEALKARLSGGTSLCQCWQIRARSGQIISATDHDRQVVWRENAYLPGLALNSSSIRQTLALAPEPLDLDGALDADGLASEDLRAGVWDGAAVTIWHVDWKAPEYGYWLWSGYLTEIEEEGSAFRVRLASIKSDLEKTIGRAYGRRCDADFGDARCGIDLQSAPQSSCDKRYATCRDVFANSDNFRGFPHMPGNDVIISGPGDKRDGSSRGVEK